jgi:hypothetical protein
MLFQRVRCWVVQVAKPFEWYCTLPLLMIATVIEEAFVFYR